jgi:hypothetical protein
MVFTLIVKNKIYSGNDTKNTKKGSGFPLGKFMVFLLDRMYGVIIRVIKNALRNSCMGFPVYELKILENKPKNDRMQPTDRSETKPKSLFWEVI